MSFSGIQIPIYNGSSNPAPNRHTQPSQQTKKQHVHKSFSGRYRAPTMDEALPLTPLAATIPFSQEILPLPTAIPSDKPTIYIGDDTYNQAKQGLLHLNTQASQERIQQSLDKVRSLIREANLTTYQFRPTKPAMARRKSQSNGANDSHTPKLSKFAGFVVKKAEFPHVCPSVATHGDSNGKLPPPSSGAATPIKKSQSSVPRKPQVQVLINQPSSPAIQTPSRTPSVANAHNGVPSASQSSSGGFKISLPSLAPEQSAAFIANAARDAKLQARLEDQAQAPKRRKRTADEMKLSSTQQEKANEALIELERLADDILYASESYRFTPGDFSDYFIQTSLVGDDSPPIVTQEKQKILQSCISKNIKAGVFDDLPVEQVMKLLKLCSGTVSCCLELSFDPQEESFDMELELAACAMRASQILLMIMTAERPEKEVYSEGELDTVLECFRAIIERCIEPVLKCRQKEESFKRYAAKEQPLDELFTICCKVLRLLGDLVSKVNFAETAMSSVEDIAINKLIFAENAPSQKDSVLGIQRFEAMRRAAMGAIVQIYTRHPNQRQDLFNSILTSLDDLPQTRQQARQYKLPDGKPIQLVSALLMQLVQASATYSDAQPTRQHKRRKLDEEESNSDDSDDDAPIMTRQRLNPIDMDNAVDYDVERAATELQKVSRRLSEMCRADANYVVRALVAKALKPKKTGDDGFRALLDLFTEDFLSVVDLPEWPAALLFLRLMLLHMFGIFRDEKNSVPQRNMALDLMTLMGSKIADVQTHTLNSTRALEKNAPDAAKRVQKQTQLLQEDRLDERSLISSSGPYRILFENLSRRVGDSQSDSARAFLLINWADASLSDLNKKDEDDVPYASVDVLLSIRNTIPDHAWMGREYIFAPADFDLGRLAYSLIISASDFCKAQSKIVQIMLEAMNCPQSQLKSKGLKSIPQLLEKTPRMLQGHSRVLAAIITSVEDSSPLVRLSALGLLEKCMAINPSIEADAVSKILALSADENVGIRKRCIKMLKDLYLKHDELDFRAKISGAILSRVRDLEESVKEIAKQCQEELWLVPFHNENISKDPVQAKLALINQVKLVVRTLSRERDGLTTFESLLAISLGENSKTKQANLKVCKTIVAYMFDLLFENDTTGHGLKQSSIARAITAYARVEPKLFTSQQMKLLKVYVKAFDRGTDSGLMQQATCVIYKHVLPSLSAIEHDFLIEIRKDLMGSVSRIPPAQLPDTAACLAIIASTLKNLASPAKLTLSTLFPLPTFLQSFAAKSIRSQELQKSGIEHDMDEAKKLLDVAKADIDRARRLIDICCAFIHACNMDSQASVFREKIPDWKGSSVSSLAIERVTPFTLLKAGRSQITVPDNVREAALRGISVICQAWPQNFLRKDVTQAFTAVFADKNESLQLAVLGGFLVFFNQEEKRSETGAEIKIGSGEAMGNERLANTYVATDRDGAAMTIAQQFLRQILHLALTRKSEPGEPDEPFRSDRLAITATEVVASINRQGVVNPKLLGPAIVALSTSKDPHIAAIAHGAHKSLHEKHGSLFEKEYIKAVFEAFKYQTNVYADPRGIILQHPPVPKLQALWEVLKNGTGKVRKHFLGNLCARVNFELPKLDFGDLNAGIPEGALYCRFVMENLACFDYVRIDEIVLVFMGMEKLVVAGVGTEVAHHIEKDILKVRLEPEGSSQEQLSQPAPASAPFATEGAQSYATEYPILTEDGLPVQTGALPAPPQQDLPIRTLPQPDPVDPVRLRQLTVASMILLVVWEARTHLRLVWGLPKSKKVNPKDIVKAPTRAPFTSNQTFLDKTALIMQALDTPDSQIALCRQFAELLARDDEVKIGEEDDLEAMARQAEGYETPNEDDEEASTGRERSASVGGSAQKGRKRKSFGAGDQPRKRAKKTGVPGKRGRPKKRTSASASPGVDANGADWD
ncbi:hypothetical protein BT63DRAFT_477042 [Microthyrium microscopicum]|uniref:Sister chromatid cohesion protein n=1 Tax=Microthyrium microscopicum TaxID=703497 RepID=A0A6A6UKF0_9PEZI|nr:hypothetical protein BT63DRAFT_477042 [Microthyrium microscopicum]